MDPGLRLLLEVTHEAILDAGKLNSASSQYFYNVTFDTIESVTLSA